MLKCWKNAADKRPTFTEIVSRYHDGLILDTSKAEQGDGRGYVLLGHEEKRVAKLSKKLSQTSIVDSMISLKDAKVSTIPSAGTTFDVIFLSPAGESKMGDRGAELDPECAAMPDQYMEMEMNCILGGRAGTSGHVLVNQAALHEYDNVAEDHQEEEVMVGAPSHGHVTTSSDHVTSGSNHCLKSAIQANGGHKLSTSTSDYILMRAANHHISAM
jgi:hypothetical protein